MSTTVPFDRYASLRIPNFQRFVVSTLALTVATQVQYVAVSFQMYEITHSALKLGYIGLAEAIPSVGTSLYAGHVVDRLDRRLVTAVATAVLAICAAALLAYTIVVPREAWSPLPLYTLIAISGFARAFLNPARTALSAELVPRELYANSATWRSVSWQIASVAGPAAGGLVYGWFGPAGAYVVDAALMVVAVLSLVAIRHTPPAREIHRGSLAASLGIGLRFVWHQPVILGAMTLDLFSVFFGGATALLPVFADRILHVGPQGLGILRAAPAAGAVLMSLFLAHRPPFRRAGHALLVAVAGFALAMIGFGLSRSFPLSLVLLVASGAADMVSVVIRSTLLQVLTPTHLLGRVSSVNSIFIGSSNEIGEAESGIAAHLLGTVPSVVFGGVVSLLVVGIVALTVPRLRRLRDLESVVPE